MSMLKMDTHFSFQVMNYELYSQKCHESNQQFDLDC
jgi:hypothetical protein